MENAIFALFMMGCGHNLDVCRPLDMPANTYETRGDCEAAIDQTARQVTTFPVSIGTCMPVTQAAADIDFHWFFAANGALVVDAIYDNPEDTIVADRADRLGEQQS